MLTDNELSQMRTKLVAIVSEVCAECDTPHIPRSEINLDDPEDCKCRCPKINAVCEALKGIDVMPECEQPTN